MSKHSNYYNPDPDHTPDGYQDDSDLQSQVDEHPLWHRENVTLFSVCIDIGSAGTQVLFSEVRLKRQAVKLSTRYLVVSRQTLFQSPISLTPYINDTLINDRALGEIIDKAYADAQLKPDQIDTGVIILTGEALRRKNSERIARILSEKCGALVCAAAGHHMEAMLAAYGSGAAKISHDFNNKLLNIDVGGGTTKLSVIDKGKILSTAAFHVGGRLAVFNKKQELIRLDPAGKTHAVRAGVNWELGKIISSNEIKTVAQSMASDLNTVLTNSPKPKELLNLYLTDPITNMEKIDGVIFSGGVSEFFYGHEKKDYQDLGFHLGKALRERIDSGELPWTLIEESEGIRSTALGGSEFTAQLSGNTSYISNPERLLPRRNIQVIQPDFNFTENFSSTELVDAIQHKLNIFDIDNHREIVLAIYWTGNPDFSRVKKLAEAIQTALRQRISQGKPIYVILNADIALNLGAILREELGLINDILILDGLELRNFDYIDIGKLRHPSLTVPVTIKSLVFRDISEGPQRKEYIHHKQPS
ncbi:MAG: recombinase [Rhodospirillaceae bacterium]|nr:recombinase [Rhodospirillaceae bacterium]|tara:strand:- start:2471 stop:4063 length:1593 start_codon:yes stop_codon:yes gene_type:complete